MLPSGNDASLALATWAGHKLLESDHQDLNSVSKTKSISDFPQTIELDTKKDQKER